MTREAGRTRSAEAADTLWGEYARTRDLRVRNALVRQFEPLAYSVAHRFAHRGARDEDLFQVALLGLVKAVERFDPHAETRFSTFATPTILGEIRHHLRDYSWHMHVPRAMQELTLRVNRMERQLTGELGRSPTAREVAARLGIPEEDAREALELRENSRPISLERDLEMGHPDRGRALNRIPGALDGELQRAEHRVALGQALARVEPALRQVIDLRYFKGLSQREIARRLHVSPMQICRRERRALERLRQIFSLSHRIAPPEC